jgi:hypothetical protein
MKKAVSDLLKPYAPQVRALALAARALVLEVMPEAIEQVDPADKLLAFGHGTKMSEIVFTIMPYTAHVNMGIANGATLPDPGGLLQGTGKHHRHVKLTTPADVAAPALRALLESAARRSHLLA